MRQVPHEPVPSNANAFLKEIIVRKEGAVIDVSLHWHGGDHTKLQLKLRPNAAGRHREPVHEEALSLIRELARLMPDRQIARLLNRLGKPTSFGNAWTQERVKGFRKHHEIEAYRDGEWAERGEISLEETANIVGVCAMTALRMLRRGDIKGRQVCPGAPWARAVPDETVRSFGGKTVRSSVRGGMRGSLDKAA
jgi:hypothetical protein